MRFTWPIVALAFSLGGAVNSNRADLARKVLAAHDPNGRLPNTKIERRGVIRIGSSKFTIYYLFFINPISRHGQQRIAIIKNAAEFMGAYQCTLSNDHWDATMAIKKDRILVNLNSMPNNPQGSFVIKFTKRGPTHNRYFCGEGSGWENSI